MKKFSLDLFFNVFVVVFCMSLIQCASVSLNAPQNTKQQEEKNTLRIGLSTNSPPLVYKQDGIISGLEIDFAHQLTTFLGKKEKFIELPWDKQISSLEKGEIDIIMSGITITPKRQYRVNFSEPYLQSGQIMLVRMEDARRFSGGIYSVMGSNYVIGTVENTMGDFYVTKTLNRAKVHKFSKSKKRDRPHYL